MKHFLILTLGLSVVAYAAPPPADGIKSKTTYAAAYGPTNNEAMVDPAKDLPRYPAVAPKDAAATWQVKTGFRLELVAHEPLVRDPIAVCFDERGRMFVCEMIDYSEMRDVTPHLGRISMLEDKDGDGFFETSQVFADNLPWPTGLIWANGGLYVGATPDIWRFEDKDGDGTAEVRQKIFTGFGTGLKILNVQGLMNSFQWGQDNRIHILAGGGNRGAIQCLLRPELPAQELGGKDFWFDPLTHEFGLEGGGAQYGMSFDNYGRKFGCSNSDHLQYWVYDTKYAARNPYYSMPAARTSIAADGGAAEVFRLSPDEPWRIIRTRWRVAGVVKGAVEGGGRVSGYFTGATGTTIYRGDAYGPDFLNNSFTGDAGGQLIHRKIIRYAENGIDLVGERPADEHGIEFAASDDTWVRVVNFANAPDGHLYVCDMYREIIEHPWSVPDEIKKHLDLNSGNDRGRIWRIVQTGANKPATYRTRPALDQASTDKLVQTLAHPNGWHRDTATRLLYEKKRLSSMLPLQDIMEGDTDPVAKLHVMQALQAIGQLTEDILLIALKDKNPFVKERALTLLDSVYPDAQYPAEVMKVITHYSFKSSSPRVAYQLALTLAGLPAGHDAVSELRSIGRKPRLVEAIASGRPEHAFRLQKEMERPAGKVGHPHEVQLALIDIIGARNESAEVQELLQLWTRDDSRLQADKLAALGTGLRRAGTTLAKVDKEGKLTAVFTKAVATAQDATAEERSRLEALSLLSLATPDQAQEALEACLKSDQSAAIQTAAVMALKDLTPKGLAHLLLTAWPGLKPKARDTAQAAVLARDDSVLALLESMGANTPVLKPADLSASQVQALAKHKNDKVSALAKTVLASVIPPSREEVVKKFQPALSLKGDAAAGNQVFMARCFACHVANGQGIEVGPGFTTVKTRGKEGLLTAILEPHKEVASQYIAYTVNTKDGQTLSGIIAKDDASSMTLKMMGGAEITVQRSNIQGSTSNGQSLMPEGLEQGMTVQEMADLITFIETAK
ncbi:PVC-type heme-binding CxxCH protein [Prosthecobacter fusiformis]|nr:PVC-type heme-binding CxxCH protein [Prosthecobacter fusiformis]